jgi:hypothetical protein
MAPVLAAALRPSAERNRQIAELVRARKYLSGAGPLGADYQLKLDRCWEVQRKRLYCTLEIISAAIRFRC